MLDDCSQNKGVKKWPHTDLADEDCSSPAELLIQGVRQPCAVSTSSEGTRLDCFSGTLTASDDGAEQVRGAVGQAE